MVVSSIYAIGQEILEGSIVDTNSPYIAKRLTREGYSVNEIKILPDNISYIVDCLENGLNNSDIVITSGGLGPTFDDLTIEALSKISGKELSLNAEAYAVLKEKMLSRHRDINEGHLKQVMLPKGSIVFNNPIGTAPCVGIEIEKKIVIALPGVPDEMTNILDLEVIPYLKKKYTSTTLYMSDLYFANISEVDVNKVILEYNIHHSVQTIINVSKGKIIVRLRSNDKDNLLKAESLLESTLDQFYFGKNDETLEDMLIKKLINKNITITTAESCTGGLIGSLLTNVAGASNVYKGGVVVYSNEAKIKFLYIDEELLKNKGAVSYEVAYHMAVNVAKKFNTNMSIAVTGIAGPTGGSKEKPVGLVYIGIFFNGQCEVYKHVFLGSRINIRERTATAALTYVYNILRQ
jgi:nicotinamide-nucleotide amidase